MEFPEILQFSFLIIHCSPVYLISKTIICCIIISIRKLLGSHSLKGSMNKTERVITGESSKNRKKATENVFIPFRKSCSAKQN